jgi:hypothetical protein
VAPPSSAPPLATAEQLQQLVSPIALYPDPLVAQILVGSTFPNQIVEAARFVQQNPNLTPDGLASQVNANPWDPSVRSLCQFPRVLQMMSTNEDWTTSLGQAYYAQPQDVLNAVQVMRRRALRANTLKSTPQQKVVVETVSASAPIAAEQGAPPQVIVIQPAQPNVTYVPQYNPSTVYGAPVAQPPGYTGTEMLLAGVAAGVVGFGAGYLTSSLINHGSNNWGTNWGGQNVVYNRNVYVPNSNYFAARYPGYRPGYPPYPGYRPGYPAAPGVRPGYPGYPANRPGYPGYAAKSPGYPGTRPGYPPGYPPRPAPYPANRANLAATNPNRGPNVPKTGTYPKRPATGSKPGIAAGNFSTARPMAKPANDLNGANPERSGEKRGVTHSSVAGSAASASGQQVPGNRHRHRRGGTGGGAGTNPGAPGGSGGMGTTGVRRARPDGG